ncbi:MAG TPA: universal stress protein [Dissulfurispiraceae bacterium]|nr:universal stress protein [Dissulfurispiraceae bacterium]
MKILVPVDGSRHSNEALKVALECAKSKGAAIDIISVAADASGIDLEISASQRERIMERMEQQADSAVKAACKIAADAGVKANCKVVTSNTSIADAILAYSEETKSDLIVMGSRGLSQSSRFKMGSVASQVVKYSDCSVYIVKLPA